MALPVVAHGVEDGIVELDGARDEQRRVVGLGRHGERRGGGQQTDWYRAYADGRRDLNPSANWALVVMVVLMVMSVL